MTYGDGNTDMVCLLNMRENGHDEPVYYFGHYGTRRYLSRQAFLRSYKFSIEVTFREKLKRSVKKLNEESLEELVKQYAIKLKKVLKSFVEGQYNGLLVTKIKNKIHFWPAACLRPSCAFGNHVSDPRHAYVFS